MSIENANSGNISICNNNSIELTSQVEDVLLLMPEIGEEKTSAQTIDDDAKIVVTGDFEIKVNSDIINDQGDVLKKKETEEENVDDDDDDDDDDDGNKITINQVSDRYTNKNNAPAPHIYANQFQISIHAGHEDDLELNLNGSNISSNQGGESTENRINNNNNSLENHHQHINMSNSSNGSINDTKEGESENTAQKLSNKYGVDEAIGHDMKYLFKNTRYYLIKSNNFENVELAKSKNVWSTPRVNEIKLNKAYRECANVLLIFSVAESGRFQGYARLASECRQDPNLQVNWVLPPNLSAKALMGVFKIDWITKNDLNFTKTQHLLNPWNENKQVKIGRDGQEYEPHCGESLCRSFNLNEVITSKTIEEDEPFFLNAYAEINQNLGSIIKKSKQRHVELAEKSKRRERNSRSKSPSPRGKDLQDRHSSSSRDEEKSHSDSTKSGVNGGGQRLANETHSYNNTNNNNYRYRYDHYNSQNNHHSSSSYNGRKRNYYNNQNPTYNNNNNSMQNSDLKSANYGGYIHNQSNGINMDFYNNNNVGHYQNHHHHHHQNSSSLIPLEQQQQQQHHHLQQQQVMFMSAHPIIQNSIQMQPSHQQQQGGEFSASNILTSNSSSSSYKSNTRNRSPTSPKKRRMSPQKYLPVSKDIVLNSTYEEYVAAAAAAAAAAKTRAYNPAEVNAYYQSNPNYPYVNQMGYQVQPALTQQQQPSQFYPNYNGYTNGSTAYGVAGGVSNAYSNSDPKTYNSKYEQDVEEFLRRTATSGSSSSNAIPPTQEIKNSSGYEDRTSSHRSSHKDHKSGSKDREKSDKDYHRSHHHKYRSSSREKTSRRRSKERR
jgi:hypothetical protein